MFPDFINFWEYVLDPVFLITTGLVLLAFAPLLWSVWVTWTSTDGSPEAELEQSPQR